MKILNVIEEGRFGGPQKRIADVSHKLRQFGIETVVVIPRDNSEKTLSELKKLDVPVRPIRMHRLTKDIKHLLKYILFFIPETFTLKKIIKEEEVDLVHCNGSWQYKAIIASKMAGVKNVWHLNDTSMPSYILKIFSFIAKHFAQNFIFACERSKTFYSDNTPEPMLEGCNEVIQAPVDTETMNPENYGKDALSEYKSIKVLTVGNVVPVKGHNTFIEMANWLTLNSDNMIDFFIVGNEWKNQSSYVRGLKKKVEDLGLNNNIHFLGGRSDIANLLSSADYYVCSSNFEASPISVWEALSMGKAIVSTDVGDVKKIFNKYNCGSIVDTQDHIAMGHALLDLIKNKKKKEYFELNARKTAQELLDIQICANKHHTIYSLALKRSHF